MELKPCTVSTVQGTIYSSLSSTTLLISINGVAKMGHVVSNHMAVKSTGNWGNTMAGSSMVIA